MGEAIQGFYSFDTNAQPDVSGNFVFSVVAFEGTVGDYSFRLQGLADIGLNGGYIVTGSTQADSVAGIAPILHSLQFGGGSLPVGVLPTTPPDLSQFATRLFTLDYFDGVNFPRLTGRIDSLTVVPEPSCFLIALSAVVVVASQRNRRVRH